MQRYKSAILAIFSLMLVSSSTASEATDLDKFNYWLVNGHAGEQWQDCPVVMTASNTSPSSANPYFKFAGTFLHITRHPANWGSCKEIGPLLTGPNKFSNQPVWWLQVVTNLHVCDMTGSNCVYQDFIRACSLSFVDPTRTLGVPGGPCGTKAGLGPAGCEVCAVPNA